MKKFLRSNQGVSLVELVIGMAILTVIGFAVATFMRTGTQSYASTSKDVNLQYEAQAVTNQLNNILTEANGAVNFYVGGTAVDVENPVSDSDNKELRIITSDRTDDGSGGFDVTYKEPIVQWRAADKELWYYEKGMTKGTDDEGNVEWTEGSDLISPELLAEDVVLFTVEIPKDAEGNRQDIAKVRINFLHDKKTFESTANIALRNQPEKNVARIDFNSGEGGEEEGGEGGESVGTITKVKVRPNYVILKPGGEVTLTARVTGSGVVNQAVTWSIDESGLASGTRVDAGGRVTVDESETADSFVVRATSVKDDSKSGTCEVAVKQVTGVAVTKTSGDTEQGSSISLKATVSGRNITSADQAVTWSVLEGAKFISQVGSETFRIASDAPVGQRVTIRATSAVDPSKYAPYSFTVRKSSIPDGGGGEGESGGGSSGEDVPTGEFLFTKSPSLLVRGNSNEDGTYTVSSKDTAGYYVDFDVVMYNEDGKLLDNSSFTYSKSGNSVVVKVLKTFAYKQSAKVKVVAYLIKNGKAKRDAVASISTTANVEPVSMGLRTDKKLAYNTTVPKQTISYAKGATKIYYELKGIALTDVTWKFSKIVVKDNKEEEKSLKSSALVKVSADKETKNGVTDRWFNFTALNGNATGSEKAKAYIGSYFLGNIVEYEAKPGNVKIKDENYGEVWAYLPLPDEDGFNFDKEKGAKLRGQWEPCKHWYDWVENGGIMQNYERIENVSSYYWYYYHFPQGCYGYEAPERWEVIVSGSTLPTADDNRKQLPDWGAKQILIPSNCKKLYTYKQHDGTWAAWAASN